MPRFRFTIGGMMVLVVVVALLAAFEVWSIRTAYGFYSDVGFLFLDNFAVWVMHHLALGFALACGLAVWEVTSWAWEVINKIWPRRMARRKACPGPLGEDRVDWPPSPGPEDRS